MTNTVLMPIGAFCSCFAIGWRIDKKLTLNPKKTLLTLSSDGLDLHPTFAKIFVVMVKYVTPLLILFIEFAGVITNVTKSSTYWFVIAFAALLAVISIVVYFLAFVNKETGTNADELEIAEVAKAKEEN